MVFDFGNKSGKRGIGRKAGKYFLSEKRIDWGKMDVGMGIDEDEPMCIP